MVFPASFYERPLALQPISNPTQEHGTSICAGVKAFFCKRFARFVSSRFSRRTLPATPGPRLGQAAARPVHAVIDRRFGRMTNRLSAATKTSGLIEA